MEGNYKLYAWPDEEILKDSAGVIKNSSDYDLKGGNASPVANGLYDPRIFGAVTRCICGKIRVPGLTCPSCKVTVRTVEEFNRTFAYYRLFNPIASSNKLKVLLQEYNKIGLTIFKDIQATSSSNEVLIQKLWSLEFNFVPYKEYLSQIKLIESTGTQSFKFEKGIIDFDDSMDILLKDSHGNDVVCLITPITNKSNFTDVGCCGLIKFLNYSFNGISLKFTKNYINQLFPIVSPAHRQVAFADIKGKLQVTLPPIHAQYKSIISVNEIVPNIIKIKKGIDQATIMCNLNLLVDRILLNQELFDTSKKSLLRKLVSTRVGASIRGNITPNDNLQINEIALPRWTTYFSLQHQIIQEITNTFSKDENITLNALYLYIQRDPIAIEAFERLISRGAVIFERPPVLFKWGMMAFGIVLTDGGTIEMHPSIAKPYNADYDGDQMLAVIETDPYLSRKLRQTMSPDQLQFYDRSEEPVFVPSHEYLMGLRFASEIVPVEHPKKVQSLEHLQQLVNKKEVDLQDEVILLPNTRTSFGRLSLDTIIGLKLDNIIGKDRLIDSKNIVKIISIISKKEDRNRIQYELHKLGSLFATVINISAAPVVDIYKEFAPEVEKIYKDVTLDGETKFKLINDLTLKRLKEELAKLPRTNFGTVIESSDRIKPDQLKNLYVPKTRFDPELNDVVMSRSSMINGLVEEDMFRQAADNRDVLVIKKMSVPISGYDTRQLQTVSMNLKYSPGLSPDKTGIIVPNDDQFTSGRTVISRNGNWARIKSMAARPFNNYIYKDEIRVKRFLYTSNDESLAYSTIGSSLASQLLEFVTQDLLGLKYGAELFTLENENVRALFDGEVVSIEPNKWLVVKEQFGREWRYLLTEASVLSKVANEVGKQFKKGNILIVSSNKVYIKNKVDPINCLLGVRTAGHNSKETTDMSVTYAFEKGPIKYTDKYVKQGKIRVGINQALIYKYPDEWEIDFGDRFSSGVLDLKKASEYYSQDILYYIFYKEFLSIVSNRADAGSLKSIASEMLEIVFAILYSSKGKSIKSASDTNKEILTRMYAGSTKSGFQSSVLSAKVEDHTTLVFPESPISQLLLRINSK